MNAPTRQLNLPSRLPSVPEAGLAPSLERRRLRFYLAQIAIDVALLLGCFWTATHLYFDDGPRGQPMLAVHLMLPIFISIALYNRTYSLQSLANWKLGSRKALVAILIAAALLNFFAFFTKSNALFSRAIFVAGLASASLLMVGSRILL